MPLLCAEVKLINFKFWGQVSATGTFFGCFLTGTHFLLWGIFLELHDFNIVQVPFLRKPIFTTLFFRYTSKEKDLARSMYFLLFISSHCLNLLWFPCTKKLIVSITYPAAAAAELYKTIFFLMVSSTFFHGFSFKPKMYYCRDLCSCPQLRWICDKRCLSL